MASPLHTLDAEVLQWLRRGAAWTGLPWPLRAQLRWRSVWATLNRRISESRVATATPLEAPIFIVGPWRSGTTVMHELLTAATGLPTPLTWQCMNASAFQLLPPPAGRGDRSGVPRPMDGLEISALSPQEDEFALLTLGVDSAYRGFLMPERLPELRHTLDPAHWNDSAPHWLPRFERFLAGVLETGGHAGQRLILKSPNHSFRLPALLRRFPDAQVIWMARDAPTVFHSNIKMWRAMFAEHQLTAAPPQGLEAFLGEALQSCAGVLNQLTSLPTQRWVVCRQSDLAERPRETLGRVLQSLSLSLTQPRELDAALARVGRGRIEEYTGEIPEPARPGILALDKAQDVAAG